MSITSIMMYYKYLDFSIKSNNIESVNYYNIFFKSQKIPYISLLNYILRLFNNLYKQNIDIIVLHSISILNCMKKNKIYLTQYTSHRLVLISLMLATKIYEDVPKLNSVWAVYGGVTLHDINIMEECILFHLKCNLFISKEQLLYIHKSIY